MISWISILDGPNKVLLDIQKYVAHFPVSAGELKIRMWCFVRGREKCLGFHSTWFNSSNKYLTIFIPGLQPFGHYFQHSGPYLPLWYWVSQGQYAWMNHGLSYHQTPSISHASSEQASAGKKVIRAQTIRCVCLCVRSPQSSLGLSLDGLAQALDFKSLNLPTHSNLSDSSSKPWERETGGMQVYWALQSSVALNNSMSVWLLVKEMRFSVDTGVINRYRREWLISALLGVCGHLLAVQAWEQSVEVSDSATLNLKMILEDSTFDQYQYLVQCSLYSPIALWLILKCAYTDYEW